MRGTPRKHEIEVEVHLEGTIFKGRVQGDFVPVHCFDGEYLYDLDNFLICVGDCDVTDEVEKEERERLRGLLRTSFAKKWR